MNESASEQLKNMKNTKEFDGCGRDQCSGMDTKVNNANPELPQVEPSTGTTGGYDIGTSTGTTGGYNVEPSTGTTSQRKSGTVPTKSK